MPDTSPWSIAGAILASLGGGAIIVAALLRWLGDIIAKRILQREQSVLLAGLEELKQELGLARLSYDKHVQHVVDYYAMFYKSYQLCQRTSRADLIRHPDREDLDTKKDYISKIDDIANDWNMRQGLLRLVLPQQALNLHEQAIGEFNAFKNLVKSYDNNSMESRNALKDCFIRIDAIKQQLESCLRIHLRTDKV
jgi:hypothetical protein